MTTKSNNQSTNQAQRSDKAVPSPMQEPINLSFHYGSIGIQAVAAAARYCGVRNKPAHAQVAQRIDQRFVESAG